MVGVVALIEGWDPVANAPVSIYAGSHDDPTVCHLNGWTWWPALAKLPTLRYDLFDGDFAGQITAPSSGLTLRTEPWPDFGRYKLADARIRLWTGTVGDAWANWSLRFDGRLTSQPTVQDGSAEVAFAVDDRWLDTALLPTYAGTTGAEGPAALKGQVKPLAIGAPRYVSGTLVDSVNSVFQVSAFAVNGFEAALDKLSRFGAPQGDYGSYAALLAAALPPGTWATAKNVGLGRFGAPPTGQVSFLLQGDAAGPDGWVRRPGRVVRRLALLAGGAGKIDDASLAALDAARPYNVSIYADQQTTARELIQSLAASLNCVAGVSWTGQLFVAPVGIGAADVTLAADGSALPPVASVQQLEQASPYQKLAMTAERTWTVHALADIAFTATLLDVGAYAAGTTYREGNVVTLADGSRYLYVSTTPAAGNAPPNAAYWSQLASAAIVDYANVSGATRPENNATAGATLGAAGGAGNVKKAAGGLWVEADLYTAAGIAGGITGQSPFATAPSVPYGSPLLTGFNTLATLALLNFNSPYLLESAGGAQATLAAFKTALGIAGGFVGQGYGATASEAAVSNARVPIGGNSVINSGFKRGQYGFSANSTTSNGLNLNSTYSGLRQVAYSNFVGTLNGGQYIDCWVTKCPWGATGLPAGSGDDMRKFCMPVVAGERVFGRVLAAAHRSGFQLYALFFDANAQFAAGPSLGTSARIDGGTGGGDPANFDLCGNYVDAPVTGYMALLIRMNGNNGVNPYLFWTEPMMGKLAPGQTVLPPYTDGPNDPIADQTIANTSAGFLGQTAFATAPTMTRANVGNYFNYSAFSLGYSITRSDGTTTVTEALAITQLGISAGFVGQAALATLNQADTAQIAPNAVTNFGSVSVSIPATSAGGSADAENTLSITTSGGRLRLETSIDTVRTGTGTNAASIQFILISSSGNEVIVGRSVRCQAVEDGPPVYYTHTISAPAGTYTVKLRLMVSNGKGSNTWTVMAGTLGAEETKR